MYINNVDHGIIRCIRSLFRLPPLVPPQTERECARKRARQRAIEKLMNGFSDQSLCTSIAISIAAYVNCGTSLYGFLMVMQIVWMSTTLQLYALLLLKRQVPYFYQVSCRYPHTKFYCTGTSRVTVLSAPFEFQDS